MRSFLRTIIASAALTTLALSPPAHAQEDQESLEKKVEELRKQVEALKQQTKKAEDKSLHKWLTIGGDYRFRIDSLRGEVPDYYQFVSPTDAPVLTPGFKPTNDTLMTNRFGLDLKAKATQNVTVTTRLLMYKAFGMQTDRPVNAGFFADRFFVLDGNIGHVPTDNDLLVDQAFATWSNIAGQGLWFSVGRRPSTGGPPTHLRQNNPAPGNGGVPGLLVDYAFDGMSLGYAPELDVLPGSYLKVCYGRGFDSGYNSQNNLRDTDMLGVQLIPYETDPLRVEFQWNRGFNIFDNPNNPGAQLGDIDWYGVDLLSLVKGIGPGTLNTFASAGISITHPNASQALLAGPGSPASGAGLLGNGSDIDDETGWAAYVGARYDLPSRTKIGVEYNHGSEFWIPFDPAADDIWTSKLGTRGNVYEGYVIQELPFQPLSSFSSKAFFKVGYQYYDFDYTGSNNWIGAPVKIADLTAGAIPAVFQNAQMFAPLKSAHDIYGTFEVKF